MHTLLFSLLLLVALSSALREAEDGSGMRFILLNEFGLNYSTVKFVSMTAPATVLAPITAAHALLVIMEMIAVQVRHDV
jgi:hypothetical protein